MFTTFVLVWAIGFACFFTALFLFMVIRSVGVCFEFRGKRIEGIYVPAFREIAAKAAVFGLGFSILVAMVVSLFGFITNAIS